MSGRPYPHGWKHLSCAGGCTRVFWVSPAVKWILCTRGGCTLLKLRQKGRTG